MSYNIDNAAIIANVGFRITAKNARKVIRTLARGDRPEGSIVDHLQRDIARREKELDDDLPGEAELPINELWWYGEGSGNTYDTLLGEVLPLTLGRADIIFTWEGGDSFSGVRVIDGKVERRKVVQALGDLEK